MKIYRANLLWTPTPEKFEIIPHGYIAVSDEGKILSVGEQNPIENLSEKSRNSIESQSKVNASLGEVIDFGDKLLIPAFNDLHLHAPQYRNNGLAMDLELLPWLNTYTFPEEMKFKDLEYARKIYTRFVHELWMQGTMRAAIFGTIHLEATQLLAQLLQDAGLGAYVGLVAMNRNSPEDLRNSTEQAIHDTIALDEQLGRNGLVKAIVTPRFIPSCTEDMSHALGVIARERQLPVQSHLSENISEIEWVKQLEPLSTCYGDAYNRYGLFGQTPTLMAHCCYSDDKEKALMRANGVYVVHCPTSNYNLASGMSPIRSYLNEGIKVALGTDISGGHYMSMLRIIQYAIQTSKIHYAQSHGKVPFLSLSEAFYLATKSGGTFFGKVGSFEPGYDFDALVVDDSYLNFANYSLQERIGRFIYIGDDRDIRVRFCLGKELKEPQI